MQLTWLVMSLLALMPTEAVKSHLFRTCEQNPFCHRNRQYAATIKETSSASPYVVDPDSIAVLDDHRVVMTVLHGDIEFPLELTYVSTGGVRLSIDEEKRRSEEIEIYGHESIQKQRYNISEWIFPDMQISKSPKLSRGDNKVTVSMKDRSEVVEVQLSPFKAGFIRGGETQVEFNGAGYFNYEEWRPLESDNAEVDEKENNEQEVLRAFTGSDGSTGATREQAWEDKFDGKLDKRTRGAEAIAADINFPEYSEVYGIPEHTDKMALKATSGDKAEHNEPYRLYNVDIFEYETESPMPMYGSIPFMHAHKKGGSVGVFWANAADTYVDINKDDSKQIKTHWMSETGLLDLFVFLGSEPKDVTRQYGALTGYASLPQTFAIGYHQCRWNYNSQEDVLEVSSEFDSHHLPMDVMWLDIEYAEGRRYFQWNGQFPDPKSMMDKLDEKSKRKLVAIIDPHVKVDDKYKPFTDMEKKQLLVKSEKGTDYHGHCWPGESVWIDTLNPKAREYWGKLLDKDGVMTSAENFHVWNDMNEPSVFDGPETSMPKSNIHWGGWEHRDIHNLYGLTVHSATLEGLHHRYKASDQRPFILTRSYFAGSQKMGAMWTGDNSAQWKYLKASIPMVLTSGISGMPFAGSDVGGFFGDPTPELLARWYQVGAFYPFFRSHAHIESKRREPYLYDDPYYSVMKRALLLRYKLLPTFYTAFYRASVDLAPIMRPLFFEFPENPETYALDGEFFIGDSGILVKPVVEEGAEHAEVYFPDSEAYYDYDTYASHIGQGTKQVAAPLEKIPMFMRGGHIHVRRDRPRRSAHLMQNDPYTVVVAVRNKDKTATGSLYIDDGVTHEYKKGQYTTVNFKYGNGQLKGSITHGNGEQKFDAPVVERIDIVGYNCKSKTATVKQNGKSWTAEVHKTANGVYVRNPRVKIGHEFVVTLD